MEIWFLLFKVVTRDLVQDLSFLDMGLAYTIAGISFLLKKVSNEIKPGDLIPQVYLVYYKDGEAVGPFGVMGSFTATGTSTVVSSIVDFHLNPQEALDAPRWQWTSGKTVQVEPSSPSTLRILYAAVVMIFFK